LISLLGLLNRGRIELVITNARLALQLGRG
jgi:hypothetical protein